MKLSRIVKKGLFITGTDTGVGKTFFTCRFIRELKKREIDVGVMKPVETGSVIGADDHIKLMQAAEIKEPRELICPYFLRAPLAPDVAAFIEGIEIDIGKIKRNFEILKEKYSLIVIEGAGGLMVPIKGRYFYLNFIEDLKMPVVIVAKNKIGVINHTLLTYRVLAESRLTVPFVVLNTIQEEKDESSEHNRRSLQKFLDIPVYEFNKDTPSGVFDNMLKDLDFAFL